MVPLPLFKLAALFVRHISKYGANRIKVQAHEHPNFRQFAARYGQAIHQLNMRLNVALLRNYDAEKRARDAAEAPTVKTKEQVEREERERRKEAADRAKYGTTAREAHPPTGPVGPAGKTTGAATLLWKRKFRALPETKAVDLFADVVGDAFILIIASALLLFEYYRTASKPDTRGEQIKDLTAELDALRAAEDERESRLRSVEAALRAYRDPKTKQPLLAAEKVVVVEVEDKKDTDKKDGKDGKDAKESPAPTQSFIMSWWKGTSAKPTSSSN